MSYEETFLAWLLPRVFSFFPAAAELKTYMTDGFIQGISEVGRKNNY